MGIRPLFFLPYSPDFTPIEDAFAKLKTFLHKAAARTVSDLSRTIGFAINTFMPTDRGDYFAAAK